MGRKADLQADLAAAGVTFAPRDTIAELENMLAEADVQVVDGNPEDVVGSPESLEARRQARRDEEAIAALNRANDQAAAKALVRTAAQQAVDRVKEQS